MCLGRCSHMNRVNLASVWGEGEVHLAYKLEKTGKFGQECKRIEARE